MRVIIQIPCYNEASTLTEVISDLPRQIPGVSSVEFLVIDDGSTDGTAELARHLGVDHVVSHGHNRGIAAAFQTGIDTCLRLGANIIVNTDGDHQYPGDQISAIVAPILRSEADVVIGDRQTIGVEHFSWSKRLLQLLGSWAVRMTSGTRVPDAASGFRAISQEAALRLNVLTSYSYTLETIIQAGKKGLRVAHVPIRINPPTRRSRLVRSNLHYVLRQATTILRIYTLYEPFKSFGYLALPFLIAGIFLIGRFLYFYITGQTYMGRHVQSVVIGGTAMTLGFLILLIGILADINAMNRQLIEESLYRQRKQELNSRARGLDGTPKKGT